MALKSWLAKNPQRAGTLGERICEGLREVGLLLIAFAPLDVALSDGGLKQHLPTMLVFLGVGLFLWLVGVIVEWKTRRYSDDH